MTATVYGTQNPGIHPSVQEATAAGLPSYTYSAGVITASSNGALTVDGVAVQANDRVLVKNETSANAPFNGIYVATNPGASGAPFVLTRAPDMAAGAQVPGSLVLVEQGTANAGALWQVVSAGPFTLGTTNITWTAFAPSGSIPKGASIVVAAPTGATATDTPAVTGAITSLASALSFGPCTLWFQDGTYQIDSNSAVIRSLANFAVKGTGATVIQQAPGRSALPNNVNGNLFMIADCTDFTVTGIVFDGNRDTVAPIVPLTATASSGQPSVTVAHNAGASYQVGQVVQVNGGWGTADSALWDFSHTISSITTGGGSGGGDLITFTTNLAHTYTQISSTLVSDGYGPVACDGAFVTPYQSGASGAGTTVAGRTFTNGQDQQNGLHLVACKRFKITGNTFRNMWESPLRLGTFETAVADGCSEGTISGNVCYHGYDQGIAVWISQNITVTGNVVDAGGWAGISCTASDHCTVTANQVLNSLYIAPDVTNYGGNGIACEGGRKNQIKGNIITGTDSAGVYFDVSPLWWGLSSTAPPTTSAYLEAGTAAGTSIQVSASGTFTVGAPYSLADTGRTEAVSVASIVDGTHITLNEQLQFSHAASTPFTARIAQENVVEGNTISNPAGGDGIQMSLTARSVIKDNVVSGAGAASGAFSCGIHCAYSNAGLPSGVYQGGQGSIIAGNIVRGCNDQGILADSTSGLVIEGNRVTGSSSGGYPGIDLKGLTDSTITANHVSDVLTGNGIKLEAGGQTAAVCARVTVTGNSVRKCDKEGILAQLGDSLIINANVVSSCGGNAGIDLKGVTRSKITGNISSSNQAVGIQLEDQTGTYCEWNYISGNTCRDDASGSNADTGAGWTQQHGIVEKGTSNYNLFTGNECDSNAVDQLTTVGAQSYAWANQISGVISGALPRALGGTAVATTPAAPASFYPADPTGTASTTLVHMGFGSTCQYTPASSGDVLIMVTGFFQIATAVQTCQAGCRYADTASLTAPSNGTAVEGTRFGASEDPSVRPPSVGGPTAFAFTAVLTGLTAGHTYWFDVVLAVPAGTDVATPHACAMSFMETS